MFRYRLAIFDFDGTIADSLPVFLTLINVAARKFGFKQCNDDELERLRNLSPKRIMKELEVPFWKLPGIAKFARSYFREHADEVFLFEGIGQVLALLGDSGMKLAIVTSNSRYNIDTILGAELVELFDWLECGTSLHGKATRIEKTARRLSIDKKDTIFIGDEVRDAEAARKARVSMGAVTWGYSGKQAMSSCGADYVFDEVSEICQLSS